MSDSTNAERPGYTMSESSVGKVFDGIFLDVLADNPGAIKLYQNCF